MPGKWSGLKGQGIPPAPVDTDFQGKVNVAKNEYQHFSTVDKAARYCELRDQKDALEAQIKELNVQLEALSQMMIQAMEQDGTDMFRLTSGDSLAIKDDPYVSITDKPVFINWIRESGQEDLLTVHYQTMSSIAKDRLTTGLPVPPGLKVFIKQSITRRRART